LGIIPAPPQPGDAKYKNLNQRIPNFIATTTHLKNLYAPQYVSSQKSQCPQNVYCQILNFNHSAKHLLEER